MNDADNSPYQGSDLLLRSVISLTIPHPKKKMSVLANCGEVLAKSFDRWPGTEENLASEKTVNS